MQKSKFRSFYTSSGNLVLFGKSSESNEKLMKTKKNGQIILHTESPGSPFCIIQEKASSEDIKETAQICACFSQQWKSKRRQSKVSVFKAENVFKLPGVKEGTFHVKDHEKILTVNLELFIGLQNNEVKALPRNCLEKVFLKLSPGNLEKEKAAEKIKKILEENNINLSREKIMQIIPAGGFEIKNV